MEPIVGANDPANLGDRVRRLEAETGFNERRNDERHVENTKRLDELNTQLAELRAELPSRDFMEAQRTRTLHDIEQLLARKIAR